MLGADIEYGTADVWLEAIAEPDVIGAVKKDVLDVT